jgi:hypothetical protein
MPVCQRIFRLELGGTFAITETTDEQVVAASGALLCGKPAFYKQVSKSGNTSIWICVDCFNDFEAQFGEGSWTDVSEFPECGWNDFEEES